MTGVISRPDSQHDGHLVPRLVHLAAVYALDGEHVEDDGVSSRWPFLRDGMPSMAILPPWLMLASMSRKAWALPDISMPTSKPSCIPSFFCTSWRVVSLGFTARVDTHLAGQFQAVRIDVGDDDVARAGVPGHGGGHDADGPGAGDEHVLAEHREGQGGVDGIAEGVEDRGDVPGHARIVPPDVGHGQGNVLGECAGTVHARRRRSPRTGGGGRPGSCGNARRPHGPRRSPSRRRESPSRWSRPRRSRPRTRGRSTMGTGIVGGAHSSHS